MVLLGKRGLETISPTLTSPKLIPPCSAFFAFDLVVDRTIKWVERSRPACGCRVPDH